MMLPPLPLFIPASLLSAQSLALDALVTPSTIGYRTVTTSVTGSRALSYQPGAAPGSCPGDFPPQ
jgi:hypothetical protein